MQTTFTTKGTADEAATLALAVHLAARVLRSPLRGPGYATLIAALGYVPEEAEVKGLAAKIETLAYELPPVRTRVGPVQLELPEAEEGPEHESQTQAPPESQDEPSQASEEAEANSQPGQAEEDPAEIPRAEDPEHSDGSGPSESPGRGPVVVMKADRAGGPVELLDPDTGEWRLAEESELGPELAGRVAIPVDLLNLAAQGDGGPAVVDLTDEELAALKASVEDTTEAERVTLYSRFGIGSGRQAVNVETGEVRDLERGEWPDDPEEVYYIAEPPDRDKYGLESAYLADRELYDLGQALTARRKRDERERERLQAWAKDHPPEGDPPVADLSDASGWAVAPFGRVAHYWRHGAPICSARPANTPHPLDLEAQEHDTGRISCQSCSTRRQAEAG